MAKENLRLPISPLYNLLKFDLNEKDRFTKVKEGRRP